MEKTQNTPNQPESLSQLVTLLLRLMQFPTVIPWSFTHGRTGSGMSWPNLVLTTVLTNSQGNKIVHSCLVQTTTNQWKRVRSAPTGREDITGKRREQIVGVFFLFLFNVKFTQNTFFFLIFKLEENCFTVLCWLLLTTMQMSYNYTSILSLWSLPPLHPLHPSGEPGCAPCVIYQLLTSYIFHTW